MSVAGDVVLCHGTSAHTPETVTLPECEGNTFRRLPFPAALPPPRNSNVLTATLQQAMTVRTEASLQSTAGEWRGQRRAQRQPWGPAPDLLQEMNEPFRDAASGCTSERPPSWLDDALVGSMRCVSPRQNVTCPRWGGGLSDRCLN